MSIQNSSNAATTSAPSVNKNKVGGAPSSFIKKPFTKKPFKKPFKKDLKKDLKLNKKKEIDEDEYSESIMGQVIDALPNTHFRVKTAKGDMIAYLGGKMRVHKIRILVGDKVELLLDEYGGKARLTKRF